MPTRNVAIVTPRRWFGEALRDELSNDPVVRCHAYSDARALCVDVNAVYIIPKSPK